MLIENLSLNEITTDQLKNDINIKAIIPPLDYQLREITSAINQEALIYAIENLEEPVLDFLAVQFHIDFYDLAKNLKMKRDAVKNSITWHMKKGTVFAIKQALKLIGIDAEFLHWHDTGDPPYTFRLRANITGDFYRTEGRDKIIASIHRAVNESKAARSVLTSLETNIFFSENSNIFAGVIPLISGQEIIKLKQDYSLGNSKIFYANAKILSGHEIISHQKISAVNSNNFIGLVTLNNISHEIGLDLNIMYDLVAAFEKRILAKLSQIEQNMILEMNLFKRDINAQIQKQNIDIKNNFEEVKDLLRWKDDEF